eukprot:CAMPEP_0202909578 /NCGR_PEP_ID=MMETSP1392-20130828/49699_1 /ASSEMBLY_ACC=CAM_ASM_000868 /TAXON_ID=225041 /ORGANISM="Chlamydomonas chlamydogama, Strain SAG 11-48b" /LENGTH=91 /DNA_ID=CAMNT_0049599375 /DNA_START=84 /DNA_END=359 /DNA_ORIENTATION=+
MLHADGLKVRQVQVEGSQTPGALVGHVQAVEERCVGCGEVDGGDGSTAEADACEGGEGQAWGGEVQGGYIVVVGQADCQGLQVGVGSADVR